MKIAIVIYHHDHLGILALAERGPLCDTRYGVVVIEMLDRRYGTSELH